VRSDARRLRPLASSLLRLPINLSVHEAVRKECRRLRSGPSAFLPIPSQLLPRFPPPGPEKIEEGANQPPTTLDWIQVLNSRVSGRGHDVGGQLKIAPSDNHVPKVRRMALKGAAWR